MGWNILGGFLILAGAIQFYAEAQIGSLVEGIIFGLIFCIPGIWIIYRHTPKGKESVAKRRLVKIEARRQKKGRKQNRYQDRAALLEQKKNSISGLRHMDGLPLAQGAECLAICKDQSLEISGGGTQFHLDLNKITDAIVKTDVEIQQAYVSSIGGAVAGAALFGTLGAMVGGRAKKKETKTLEHYLIITYFK